MGFLTGAVKVAVAIFTIAAGGTAGKNGVKDLKNTLGKNKK